MNNKLPSVFANKIDRGISNNSKVAYASKEEPVDLNVSKSLNVGQIEKNINQKIAAIFNSPRYVYKADVIIKLKDKTVNKKIVGKNGNNIITLENELISISDIVDIHFAE